MEMIHNIVSKTPMIYHWDLYQQMPCHRFISTFGVCLLRKLIDTMEEWIYVLMNDAYT